MKASNVRVVSRCFGRPFQRIQNHSCLFIWMLDDKFKTKVTFYYSLARLVVSSTARLVCTCRATTQWVLPTRDSHLKKQRDSFNNITSPRTHEIIQSELLSWAAILQRWLSIHKESWQSCQAWDVSTWCRAVKIQRVWTALQCKISAVFPYSHIP